MHEISDAMLVALARLAADCQLCGLVLKGNIGLARRILSSPSGAILEMTKEECSEYAKAQVCISIADVEAFRVEIG